VTYSYDLLGRITGASQTGNALSFAYDALGRNTGQSGPLGTVSYQFDLAGRKAGRISYSGDQPRSKGKFGAGGQVSGGASK